MSAVIDSIPMRAGSTPTLPMARPQPAPAVAASETLSATERLEQTRAQLRLAMTPGAKPTDKPNSGVMDGAKSVLQTLRTIPGAPLVVDTLLHWWARHPLRDASVIAREASGAILRPIARDNPMKLVFGALLLGALLVIVKPWRFILRSAIFAGLVPQFAVMALRRLPIGTWIRMFANRPRKKVQPPAGAAPADTHERRAI